MKAGFTGQESPPHKSAHRVIFPTNPQEGLMNCFLATAFLLGFMVAPAPLRALEDPAPRTITISGDAEMMVAPDDLE
jgi:hypothetical protein